ncbi:MAG: ABC-F family ATP-binding cassette domain-containing protein [Desulfobacteraceae bacterium]|nr:ABC-F family ATP-binding cassette domain-containing protein [Desulfobacteraceae bacterium]
MSLVTVLKVSLTFVRKQVFDEIGFQVAPGNRIGLIGPNGSGKTTLLRLLNGEISPDSGEVRREKGIAIGYLPQDVQETLAGPLLQSIYDSIPGRLRFEDDRARLEETLEEVKHVEQQAKLAARLAEIHQELSRLEFEFPRHDAEKILLGLGFKMSDLTMSIATLSGGWKTRAALASLLYQRPDLLLLDEPTNHLDIPSIRWLEQYLQGFKGAMILVSHDKDFLNRQIHRILSFEPEGMKSYSGNYDFYLKTREEEKRSLDASARKQEQKIKDAQKFIDRFQAKASKARQAQSKIKLVKKMELVKRPLREKKTRFSFPEVPRSGRQVVTIKGLSKGFDGNLLYRDINLNVLRGEKIAIIGPNGCGKTTLLKMIAGEIDPDRGTISLGHGVNMVYFAQHHSDMLNPQKTVIQEVYQIVPEETIGFVRGVCGAFLFSGEDVDKPVGVLSGGERARVLLAKLLVRPGNLMVMDEPTNHLDIESSETLIDALSDYNGTLMFVSHNLSFINRSATKVWDLGGREITEYPGNLDEYYDHLSRMGEGPENGLSGAKKRTKKPTVQKTRDQKRERKERAERRRIIHDTLKPIQTELENLERRIAEREARQEEVEKMLADPSVFSDKNKSVPLLKEYSESRRELDDLLLRWEQAENKLESAKQMLGI